MPPGSAVFETISTETYEGVIHTPMYNISPLVLSSGVLTYEANGVSSKLLFAEKDFKVGRTLVVETCKLDAMP